MAQWQDLLRLDPVFQSRVSQLYEGKFPREMRHWLSSQIESYDWHVAAMNEDQASACFFSLLDYLEGQRKRSVQENNMLQGPDFAGMRAYLLRNFEDNPKHLAAVLCECLMEEKRILDAASEEQACCRPTVEPKAIELDNQINCLKSLILEIKKKNKSLEGLYEELEFTQEVCREQGVTEGLKKQVLMERHVRKRKICQNTADIISHKQQVLLQSTTIVKEAEEIVLRLVDVELPEWRRRQQLACVGSPVNTSLHHLQNWFTSALEVLLELREQLQKLQQQDQKYNSADASEVSAPVGEVQNAAASLCIKLLENALVVEKQPVMSSLPQRPLIVKTKVQFSVSVRFLANLPNFKYLLKVKPAFDKGVNEASTVKGFRQFSVRKDDFKVLDEDTPGGGLVAEFGHMSLKEAKAKAKVKGTTEIRLGVTEELHLLTFVTHFRHAGLECTIEASTLPVVVISSSNQVASAWASIMWCSMLCTGEAMNLSLFVEPPALTWTQLSQLLNWQFLTVGQRELDQDQLSQLREKFVDPDGPDELVHWTQFSKKNNSWIWIDGILELIKTHLVDLWKEGWIMGFVSRERTRQLLQEKENGTFLLRFSESNKEGAITFSWVEHVDDRTRVHAVEPYTKEELTFISLPNVIDLFRVTSHDCTSSNPLLYLYPHIPKDSVFKRLCSMAGEKKTGYLFKKFVPVTFCPTMLLSPPPPDPMMDLDLDLDLDMDVFMNPDFSQLMEDVFPGLKDICEEPHQQWFTSDTS